jgi:small subunit ribosomal protein S16
MLKIKLFPKGKKHQITFRIVVAEARSKYNGKFVADLGFVTPQTNTVQINREELAKWIKNGAQVTLGVDKILNPDKHVRPAKVKPVKEAKTEEVKEEVKVEETPVETEAVTETTA